MDTQETDVDQERIGVIGDTLRTAVNASLERGERPSRATMSTLDFSLLWQHLGALGVKWKSMQQALVIDVHYPACSVTVAPSPWCPVGRVGVA